MIMDLIQSNVFVLSAILITSLLEVSRTDEEHGIFLATSECETLVETYRNIIEDLQEYVSKEEHRLSIIKRYIVNYKKEQNIVMIDDSNSMKNPLNAFILIKKLTTGLSAVKEQLQEGIENNKEMITTLQTQAADLPATEDLEGAALGLRRVQFTYKLDVKELAEGKINGVVISLPMTADDCYVLSTILFGTDDYYGALAWMLEALKKYKSNKTDVEFSQTKSWNSYLGNLVKAVKTYQEDPERAEIDTFQMYDEYEGALCRGELEICHNFTKRLTCFLMNDRPFLRIAPIKTEQLYIQPDIFLFYNVLSDEEIEHLKSLATPELERAQVVDVENETNVYSIERIGKNAWLEDTDVVTHISQRVSDLTGLDLTSAEKLQLVNYGIGGHYVSHYDFDQKGETVISSVAERGNRIATVLFYLSEVAQGGATVFPELGLSVFPIKNAAVFWINLHPSGEGDLSTLHASCPVLNGSKWIATKWLHQVGQEFIRPCTLEYQQEEETREFPKAVLKSNT